MLKSKCSDAVSKFDANSRQISNTNCPTVTLIPKFAIFLLQFSDHFENSNTLTCCLPFTRKKITSAQFCSTGKHFLESNGHPCLQDDLLLVVRLGGGKLGALDES